MLNDHMVAEELEEQLEEMATQGAKSVCMHPLPREFRWNTQMSPEYLSEEYHAIVRRLVEKAKRLGMNFYLYDEGGWPSGGACGRVIASNPERFARSYVKSDGKGGFEIVKIQPHPENCAPYPDILIPGVTETFLELTHNSYVRHWGEDFFGKTVRYVFTDEPSFMPRGNGTLGWTPDLPAEFLRRKGYALEPWIPALLDLRGVIPGSRAGQVAIDYTDVMTQLFIERYLTPLREWCHKHHLQLCGHFGGEDEWLLYHRMGFGNILQALRNLDMPGIDVIWRQLYPGKRLHPFPKLASSTAHQNGTAEVLTETFGVYGSGLAPETMKYLIDFLAICGVNRFIFHNISQKLRDGNMAAIRPHYGPVDPLWSHVKSLHDYTARLSYLTSLGSPVRDTALFFDHNAFTLGGRNAEYAIFRGVKAAELLLESQCDFDYVDDEMLATAKIRGKRLQVGKAFYRRVVLPTDTRLSDKAQQLLEKFRAAGGEVMDAEAPEVTDSPLLQIEPKTRALLVSKRDLGKGESLYFIFNTTSHAIKARIAFPENAPLALADLESGALYRVPEDKEAWDFRPWQSRVFISGREGDTPMPAEPGDALQEVKGNWRIQPLWHRVAGEHTYETIICPEQDFPAALGDWLATLGKDFSGDARYTISFRCSAPEKAAFLDLGRVCCAACVTLNGKKLGRRSWSPYIFEVGNALKRGLNRLEITVTNTLANAISDDSVEEHWKKDFPPESPYEWQQRVFERDELASGLFGPVRLLV